MLDLTFQTKKTKIKILKEKKEAWMKIYQIENINRDKEIMYIKKQNGVETIIKNATGSRVELKGGKNN